MRFLRRPTFHLATAASSRANRLLRPAAAACLMLFCPANALADEPDRNGLSHEQDLTSVSRLGAALSLSAAQARAGRRSVMVTGLVTGAALLPAGLVLANRPDDVSHSIGIGMVVGGSAQLMFSTLSLFHSRVEGLELEYEQRAASGMPPDELVRRTEADWKRIAGEAHDRRISTSLIEIGTGGVATAAGVTLLLAQPMGGMSRTQQYNVGSALVGPGVPILSLGLRGLMQRTTAENGWSAYQVTNGSSARSETAHSTLESVGLAPLPRGAFASLTFSL